MKYGYPLKLRFRLIALAPRIDVEDANGQKVFYIEQKVFALKEAVKVFDNEKDKNLLYTIQADQVIDFGAQYFFRTVKQHEIGSVKQEGMRSLFQASFNVFDKQGKEIYKIIQSNPWVGIINSVVSMIPFAEIITNFVLHPVYAVAEKEGADPAMTMRKKPSFFESEFEITKHKDLSEQDELLCLLSILMLVQLERNRG